MNLSPLAWKKRGEILARTPRMTPGYFMMSRYRARGDGTLAPPLDNGRADGDALAAPADSNFIVLSGRRYFRTGDIGELVSSGDVRVIDRCTACFKLAGGESNTGIRLAL